MALEVTSLFIRLNPLKPIVLLSSSSEIKPSSLSKLPSKVKGVPTELILLVWVNSTAMTSPKKHPADTAAAVLVQSSPPRYPSGTPDAGAQRKIGIAVDLSDESAYAVCWAVQNYLRYIYLSQDEPYHYSFFNSGS